MIHYFEKRHKTLPYRIFSAFVAVTFITGVVLPPSAAAQVILNLPAPGTMVVPSGGFIAPRLIGVTIHPDNPLKFDFIVNSGDDDLAPDVLKEESRKLIKYFLASLTVPEDELWVNLSPYERDHMVPQGLGDTEMGRDMLAQDYLLKQLTASLMYPEKELGQKFWEKIYKEAREKYGTTEIPVNTFNKVWVVPREAVVYEKGTSAYVVKSRLRVMLEEDYQAMSHQDTKSSFASLRIPRRNPERSEGQGHNDTGDVVTTGIIREVIIPAIEQEVNEGENFANLRQMYNSLILAAWYKLKLKDGLLGKIYVDQNKTKGIDTEDKTVNQKIYDQYLESFKKGVYNYIKEDVDPATQDVIPRKYFSGGIGFNTFVNDRVKGLGNKLLALVLATMVSEATIQPAQAAELIAAIQNDKNNRIEVVLGENPLKSADETLAALEPSLDEQNTSDEPSSSPVEAEDIQNMANEILHSKNLPHGFTAVVDIQWNVTEKIPINFQGKLDMQDVAARINITIHINTPKIKQKREILSFFITRDNWMVATSDRSAPGKESVPPRFQYIKEPGQADSRGIEETIRLFLNGVIDSNLGNFLQRGWGALSGPPGYYSPAPVEWRVRDLAKTKEEFQQKIIAPLEKEFNVSLPAGSVQEFYDDNVRMSSLLLDVSDMASFHDSAFFNAKYGQTKSSSPVDIEREIAGGKKVGDALHTVLSPASPFAGDFLKGGYRQPGYGVEAGAVIDGSHAIGEEGNQGYYVDQTNVPDGKEGFKSGKQVFVDTVNDMKMFFSRRAEFNKPIRVVIKTGIGGQHTPFQGMASVFERLDSGENRILGEYELGKDFESYLTKIVREMNIGWDQIAVIPSSKSGSTDETMIVFTQIIHVLLGHVMQTHVNENAAGNMTIDQQKFGQAFLDYLHTINFKDGKELPAGDLFKNFNLDDLVVRIHEDAGPNRLIPPEWIKQVLGKVLGNMFFETTDRPAASRLSAFIRNSGLDRILGKDAPGFGAMFDNVGGRWTGDLHMMTFLSFYDLDPQAYWQVRYEGIKQVRAGTHQGNAIGNKILDKDIKKIALVVPDEYFWFGKSIEQNFNESIWQEGFANLRAIKQSTWEKQKRYYESASRALVLNLTDLAIEDTFNVVNIDPVHGTLKQELAQEFGRLLTTFYGMTYTVGTRLIARALFEHGAPLREGVDVNNLDDRATKILQENLFLRQPFVELGKNLLEKRLTELQAAQQEWIKWPYGNEPFGDGKRKTSPIDQAIDAAQGKEIRVFNPFWNERELPELVRRAAFAARQTGKTFVPFIYLAGEEFVHLRDYLQGLGVEWVLQGSGDQHISWQQVLAQPDNYLPFIISFVPEADRMTPGLPAVGFAKGYLDNISPHMVRDYFAEASYQALVDQGGKGIFMRILDTQETREELKAAFETAFVSSPVRQMIFSSQQFLKVALGEHEWKEYVNLPLLVELKKADPEGTPKRIKMTMTRFGGNNMNDAVVIGDDTNLMEIKISLKDITRVVVMRWFSLTEFSEVVDKKYIKEGDKLDVYVRIGPGGERYRITGQFFRATQNELWLTMPEGSKISIAQDNISSFNASSPVEENRAQGTGDRVQEGVETPTILTADEILGIKPGKNLVINGNVLVRDRLVKEGVVVVSYNKQSDHDLYSINIRINERNTITLYISKRDKKHESTDPLFFDSLPSQLQPIDFPTDKIRFYYPQYVNAFDTGSPALIFRGIMSPEERDALLKVSDNPNYQRAIKMLFHKSNHSIRAVVEDAGQIVKGYESKMLTPEESNELWKTLAIKSEVSPDGKTVNVVRVSQEVIDYFKLEHVSYHDNTFVTEFASSPVGETVLLKNRMQADIGDVNRIVQGIKLLGPSQQYDLYQKSRDLNYQLPQETADALRNLQLLPFLEDVRNIALSMIKINRDDQENPRIEIVSPVAPTVLVVDNDPSSRELTERLLSGAEEAFEVVTATDGEDALKKVKLYGAYRFKAAVVDRMGGPGIELVKLLKKEAPQLRVILKSTLEEDYLPEEELRQMEGLLAAPLFYEGDLAEKLVDTVTQVLASSPAVNQGVGDRVQGPEVASEGFTKGGIDLNPELLDLQIKRDGNGVPLPLPQQPIENMHIDGFLPIIINITPVTNLPMLLGLADTKQNTDEITPAMKAREPEEMSALN